MNDLTPSLLYEQARHLIKSGDIVFVRGKKHKLVQRLIMFFTQSLYSHVGIAFWITTNGHQRLMIVEAQGGTNRRILNLSFYAGRKLDIVAAPKLWDDVNEEALDRLGQVEYGWLDAVYVGTREFLLKNFKIRLPATNFSGEICSEYVARVYQLPKVDISPQGLYETLKKLGYKIKMRVV